MQSLHILPVNIYNTLKWASFKDLNLSFNLNRQVVIKLVNLMHACNTAVVQTATTNTAVFEITNTLLLL